MQWHLNIYLFIWLHRVLFIYLFLYLFLAVLGLHFCARAFSSCGKRGATHHRGVRASSLSRPFLLRSTGSRRAGSVAVAHGPSCSAACGIFPDQGSNPCPLHQQADSQPLHHQGSPYHTLKLNTASPYPHSWCFSKACSFTLFSPLPQSPHEWNEKCNPSRLDSEHGCHH